MFHDKNVAAFSEKAVLIFSYIAFDESIGDI
jgi:hypothetical protein